MERCNTLNLDDYIKERRSKNVPLNPDEAFKHAKQVIDAIDHIHGHNILHRDLKPSSILFSLCGRYLKICDFGVSKNLEHGHTVTGLSTLEVGTDGYRAPETYNKDVISKMADIFSLALVLCHLLSYGFHPFGTDPTIWSYNIKNGQGLDLSRLRVPFLKIVKEMLEKMLNFEPKDRLKIDQVKNSECMKLDWFPSIIESLVPIWNGAVKDRVGADMLSCQLYRSPSLQDVIKIDESGWKFEMNNTVPYFDIGSLKKVTDEEPSGYIVTSKDELKIITDKLAGNLMGCIDISKDGKDSKVIVLLFQPGYPELFGFFFPDTKILTSFLGNLAAKQRSTTQELEAGPDTHHFASESSSTSDTAVTRSKRTVKDEPLSTSRSTGARLKRKVKKESLSTSDTAGARSKRAVKDEPLATSRSTGERLKRKAKKESSSTSDTTGAISKRTVKDESPSTSRSTRARPKRKAKKVSTSATFAARRKRTSKKESSSTSRSTRARPKRKAKKESASISGTTGARLKQAVKEDCIELPDSIWMFRNKKISTHGEIYEGELRSKIHDARPIVLKLVENIPQGLTEARILAKLNYHSHVLSLIQAGTFKYRFVDQVYIALDKCHHENLREFVTNCKNSFGFNLNLAIEIAKQMIDGVKHIHENRIIHKDIKPDNILFSLDQRLIKIADFGVSQEIDSTSTELFEKRQFGTDGFRPPESFGKGFISQKSDIFSLGVTFCFVLSNGEHPFGKDRAGWNYHMKKGIIDLSGLLVPNKKTTEHLIKSMIEHKINDRPTIWQVSEHPFWTGNEVSCDFGYHCPENAVSLTPPTSEEPSHNIANISQLQEHVKKIQLRDEAVAEKIHERAKDGDADLMTTKVGSHSAVTYDFHKAVNAIAVFDKNSKAIQAFKPSDQSWTRLHVVTDEIINKQSFTAVALDDDIIVFAIDKTNYRLKYTDPDPKWIPLPDRSEYGPVVAVALHGEVYAFDDQHLFDHISWSSEMTKPSFCRTIEKLDIHQTSWSQMTKPFHCIGEAVIAVGDFIYTFGGYSGGDLSEAAKFDPNTSTWSDLPSMPTARFHAGAAALDGRIYVMGGAANYSALTTTENFDIQSQVWTRVKPMINPHQYFNACTIDGKIYAVGGSGSKNLIDEYDPDADTWQTVGTMDGKAILKRATISISN